MTTPIRLQHTVLVLALAAIYPLQATAAASAGVAQFTAGDVNVRRPDGGVAPLSKGKDIESGESIVTGVNGRAQVKFTDGGLISLQPNTEFKIASYTDNAANPKEERFLVDLLRGSMRAITGLIGKRNRENYKVNTATATIGIRGSGFNVGYNPDGSLGVTTELDAIEVCNAGGCVGLTAGESVRVVSSNEAPVRTNVKATIPTPGPERDPVVVGDKVNSEGKASIVPANDTAKAVDGKVSNTGTFTGIVGVAHYHTALNATDQNGTFLVPTSGSATLDAGKLTSATVTGSVYNVTSSGDAKSLGTIATSDFIGWGKWVSGTRDFAGSTVNVYALHYVVGQPTAVLPTTVGLASYSLVGSTVPTNYLGTSGTLTSATFQVNFDPAQVGGPLLKVNVATSFGSVTENFIYFSSSTFASGSGSVKGFFSGANALRAGLVYNGTVTLGTVGGTFTGALVFQK